MYNPYQQGGYQGYQQYPQGYPLQQQATGYYPAQQGLFQGQQTGLPQSAPTGFQQQQTGFPQQFSQPQNGTQAPQTGFQAQQTGFQPQLQQQQPQTGFNAPGTAPAGFSQTGFGPSSQGTFQDTPLQAQKTGFTAALADVTENTELKIPNMRLSFITAADQTKFEHLFRTAVTTGNSVSGDAARDILLRSGLPPVTLAEIWALADTNKSGSLLFPEFALALHLCNMALRGDALPASLPQLWANEVQSFVDAISFSVPEDPAVVLANTPFAGYASAPATSAAPPTSFVAQPTGGALSAQRTGGGSLIPLQPQQTASLVPAQTTGFQGSQQQSSGFQGVQPQSTGFQGVQPQSTGFQGVQPQSTGFQGVQPQTTGFQGVQRQTTGFQGVQPQTTGYGVQPQSTGFQGLVAQPTGVPGQWGFVHAPTGGIPGLSAMQQHFLPSASLPSHKLQNAMDGSLQSNVTWAITKQEKTIYDGIFAAWDTAHHGYIEGDVAISIFGKSGLSRPDLESIWNLCDSSNRGKLNKDEFAVAMHLVYRRLNGLDIPLRLPPELVPPSAKYLQDSVDSLKNSLKGGSARKTAPVAKATTSASRFKNDDDNVAYVSSSRHKSRKPRDEQGAVQTSKSKDLSVQDLKKLIHEKRILLDALDVEDQHNSIAQKQEDERNYREIDHLKRQIRDVQAQLNSSAVGGSSAEKKQLLEKLEHFTKDKVPTLMAQIYQVTADITKAKVELAKAHLKQQYPDWSPENAQDDIVGTGVNGEVTESDIRKHKSKQLLKQRMAALTGKPYASGSNKDADFKLQQETENAKSENESQQAMIKDIESSIKDLEEGAVVHLQTSIKSETTASKWEEGNGVSSILKEFIQELNDSSKANGHAPPVQSANAERPANSTSSSASSTAAPINSIPKAKPTYKTPEERSAYIKAQAEKRMNERLAKLGISRNKNSSQPEPPKAESPKAESPKAESPKAEPVAEQSAKPVAKPVAESVAKEEKPAPSHASVPSNVPEPAEQKEPEASSDDDEEDAEYAALLKQKQELESRKKEKDLKKKQDREARLAKLKQEMAALENDDESDEEPSQAASYKPSSVAKPKEVVPEKAEPASVPETEAPVAPSATETESEKQAPHKSNPFAKFSAGGQAPAAAVDIPGVNSNPFFKATKKEEPNAKKKLEAQRASQRGLGSEDWSDEEENSSDDEEPNRAGAAKLASLLFGGMPQPISRAPTGNAAFATQQPAQHQVPAASVEPSQVPQAPPVPEAPVEPPQAPQAPPVPEAPVEQAPQTPPIPEAPVEPPQVPPVAAASVASDEDSSDFDNTTDSSDDEFATPSPQVVDDPLDYSQEQIVPPVPAGVPPVPTSVPPVPTEAPPVPTEAPPVPTEAPPVPTEAPPVPSSAPPTIPPPPPQPPVPSAAPPVPPPAPPAPGGPPPPPSFLNAAAAPSATPAGGMPNIGALLGQIQGGKSLRKVDDAEKHIADGAVLGKVL